MTRAPCLLTVQGGPFGAILADPPWAFENYSGGACTPHRTAEDHYPTMARNDLAALPVSAIAARDCALFMWVIGSHLEEALALGRAWGFTYKTDAFYWLKQKLIDANQIGLFTGDIEDLPPGMGYWSRKQIELCLLFTRGRPSVKSRAVRQMIIEPRREHSRKPDCVHERIAQLVGGPYLEMFARAPRAGWAVWGNETGRFAGQEAAA